MQWWGDVCQQVQLGTTVSKKISTFLTKQTRNESALHPGPLVDLFHRLSTKFFTGDIEATIGSRLGTRQRIHAGISRCDACQ